MNKVIKEHIPSAILHIPHSSSYIPIDLLHQFKLPLRELEEEKQILVDHFTDDLFLAEENIARRIIFPVCRLLVDPERFLDDSKEPMSKHGMGVVYTNKSDGKKLRWNLYRKEIELLIEQFYLPHQKKISNLAQQSIEHNGKCLLIDCHSFPNKPFPYESDERSERPDICIGTDEYHTPKWLSEFTVNLFKKDGFEVYINKPFEGSYVPDEFYQKDNRLSSIMIELNRSIYMNEGKCVKNRDYPKFKEMMKKNIELIIEKASKIN